MTEEQKARIMEIAGITDMGQLSDGYHTFDSLYNQRLNLFAALVNTYRDRSWKTWNHEDGTPCFGGGWFLVCIDTPDGPYSYHYEAKDWDMFDCKELEKAKPFDGHTDKDVGRVLSLAPGKESYEMELNTFPRIRNRRMWPDEAIAKFMERPREERVVTLNYRQDNNELDVTKGDKIAGFVEKMDADSVTVALTGTPDGKLVADMLAKKVPLHFQMRGFGEIANDDNLYSEIRNATLTGVDLVYEGK